MKKLSLLLTGLIITLGVNAQNTADFVLPSIISDHAVMKRNSPVKLWGWCPAEWDLKIVCSWADKDTVHVSSDKYSYWETLIQTPNEEGPFSIRFFGLGNKLCAEVEDILMGEPWLCSGQGNMEYSLRTYIDDNRDGAKLFSNDKIRVFKVCKASSRYPVERIQGKWELCTKEKMEDFSAVAYYFGDRLSEGLGDIPVGLIGSYWSGTSIEPWMDDFIIRHENLEPLTEKCQLSLTPTANSCLYNAMIYPIQNYRISGVIWYQGESNCKRHEDYGKMLSALIRGWRRCFHTFLPFYMVQIAPYEGYSGKTAAFLREQQEIVAKSLMNTGIVHVGDLVNDVRDCHPKFKRQVGERLANLALYKTYGKQELQPFSPEYESFAVKENAIVLKTTDKVSSSVKGITGFEIVDAQDNLHPARAVILKDGSIRLTAKDVESLVGVRYCFDNVATPNIFGSNGLPLAPFRTDKSVARIDGTFFQPYGTEDWNDARWDQEMQVVKNAGMHYFIFVPSAEEDSKGILHCHYDVLEKCLKSAQKHGIRVFVGLNYSGGWWRPDNTYEWLRSQMEMGNRVADEVLSRYKKKYAEALYGWYWVWEVSNLLPGTLEQEKTLINAMNINLDHLHTVAPSMPFLFSPFVNYKVGKDKNETAAMWKRILPEVHFLRGDVFCPQDCVGAGGLELGMQEEWMLALSEAAKTVDGLEFWINVETFDQKYWSSATLPRLVEQIRSASHVASNIVCFSYCSYNSPTTVAPCYDKAYRQYLKTGSLPSMPAPVAPVELRVEKSDNGDRLVWKCSDEDNTAGYNVYYYGKLLRKILKRNGQDCEYLTLSETDTPSGFSISAYNVLDVESAHKTL